MALSNWDTMAFALDGQPIAGTFTSPSGVVVSVYKNWIYVEDDKAWTEGSGYSHPVVLEVQEGRLTYKDVDMVAIRGPQTGVFVFAASHPIGPDGKRDHKTDIGMLGIGVYGYDDRGEFVGVTQETLDWLRAKLSEKVKVDTSGWDPALMAMEALDPLYEHVLDVPEGFRSIDLGVGQRFNQGDAYFAGKLGTLVPATSPGEPAPTVMSRIIADMSQTPQSASPAGPAAPSAATDGTEPTPAPPMLPEASSGPTQPSPADLPSDE